MLSIIIIIALATAGTTRTAVGVPSSPPATTSVNNQTANEQGGGINDSSTTIPFHFPFDTGLNRI
jgi:hypothetical protein